MAYCEWLHHRQVVYKGTIDCYIFYTNIIGMKDG